ncbi:hypothetical protein NC651_039007 [Populus alba x Populus x berolinensis]|nr:hypothetical protein NC651_039007 [Populus alba x Populus x berolinensis]
MKRRLYRRSRGQLQLSMKMESQTKMETHPPRPMFLPLKGNLFPILKAIHSLHLHLHVWKQTSSEQLGPLFVYLGSLQSYG